MVGQSGNTPKAVSRDITFLEIQNYPEKCSRSNEKGTRKGIPHDALLPLSVSDSELIGSWDQEGIELKERI